MLCDAIVADAVVVVDVKTVSITSRQTDSGAVTMKNSKLQTWKYIDRVPFVVYFDQRLGAAHSPQKMSFFP